MKKMTFPRPALLAALVAATCCTGPRRQDGELGRPAQRRQDPQDVLSYGLGLKAQRHSTLAKVNTRNVANLVPAWSFSFGGEKQRGQEGQALVHDGVIYATSSYSRIFAIDARSGKRLWEYEARLPDDIRPCCDVVNRGPAIYGDKIFFGTLDASIVALNKDTGKVVWKKKFGDHKIGYTMTGAPSW
jgi:alcohol dehydrogenase (cytochrome c)